ncbi:MAG: hypothetical protein JXA10_06290 [Anaerolineae bacterium]|nr:hypothetical protein [Anaerolineae bacterium]
MSNWRKRRTTIHFNHPEYDDYWASVNRARALIGEPPIPHGQPLEIEIRQYVSSRHEPLGIGYCQGCGEIMLMNDEQQKWCPTCRAERKRKYVENRPEKRSENRAEKRSDRRKHDSHTDD